MSRFLKSLCYILIERLLHGGEQMSFARGMQILFFGEILTKVKSAYGLGSPAHSSLGFHASPHPKLSVLTNAVDQAASIDKRGIRWVAFDKRTCSTRTYISYELLDARFKAHGCDQAEMRSYVNIFRLAISAFSAVAPRVKISYELIGYLFGYLWEITNSDIHDG